MFKLLFLGATMFSLVVGVGYSGLWYMQSLSLMSFVEDRVAEINKEKPYISYDTIETSGFPKKLNLHIVNPRFTGRIDKIFQGIQPENTDKTSQNNENTASNKPKTRQKSGKTMPRWEENIALNGQIIFSVDMTASHYALIIEGDTLNSSNIDDKSYKLHTQPIDNVSCQLQMTSTLGLIGSLWNFESIARDPKTFIHDLRQLDCNSQGHTVLNHNTGETIMTTGPTRLFIESLEDENDEGYRKQRLYITSESEVLKSGDSILAAYIQALSPGSTTQPNFSVHGKKKLDIDLNYHGPLDISLLSQNVPVDIRLNKLEMSSNVHQSNSSFHYNNTATTEQRDITLSFLSESNFKEDYNTLLEDTVRGMILQLYSPYVVQPANIQPLIRKYNANELYHLIAPAIPNLFSLGQLTQSAHIKYTGSADFSTGNISFTKLNLSSTPYGITGKGALTMAQGQPLPAANVALTCRNCLQLIDDATQYMTRLKHAMSILSDTPSDITSFTTYQSDGIKDFLKTIGDASSVSPQVVGTFDYAIISNGFNNVSINDLPLDKVLAIYNQKVATSQSSR